MRRFRPSYASVAATLALVFSIGGVGYAVTIAPADSVDSAAIINGQVKGADIAKSAVTGAKVKSDTLDALDIAGLQTLQNGTEFVFTPTDGQSQSATFLDEGTFQLIGTCARSGATLTAGLSVKSTWVAPGMFTSSLTPDGVIIAAGGEVALGTIAQGSSFQYRTVQFAADASADEMQGIVAAGVYTPEDASPNCTFHGIALG
jgi:hypothetical protein